MLSLFISSSVPRWWWSSSFSWSDARVASCSRTIPAFSPFSLLPASRHRLRITWFLVFSHPFLDFFAPLLFIISLPSCERIKNFSLASLDPVWYTTRCSRLKPLTLYTLESCETLLRLNLEWVEHRTFSQSTSYIESEVRPSGRVSHERKVLWIVHVSPQDWHRQSSSCTCFR